MSLTYSVHSMFATIQGEGPNTGRRSVFVRFSNCNIWSGKEEDRFSDSGKGRCALICDTVFKGVDMDKGGGLLSEGFLLARIMLMLQTSGAQLVTFTGGEPSLQLGRPLCRLVSLLRAEGIEVEMESNGAREVLGLNYLTLSPKFPFPPHESWRKNNQRQVCVKLLFPLYTVENAVEVLGIKGREFPVYLQPVDVDLLASGWQGTTTQENTLAAAQEVMNPKWKHLDLRLSLQTHKYAGMP